MIWNSSAKNMTTSCLICFANENSLILFQFTLPSKPVRVICSVLLILLIIISIYLNTSSIYFIWHEMRRRTHVNLLLSSQSLADLSINLMVMLPISIFAVTNAPNRPSYHLCLIISFLDHWFHSITMLTMAEIIADRYKVIVQRRLSAITRRTEKSMAAVTVIWAAAFVLSICYVTQFLRKTNWSSLIEPCNELQGCMSSRNAVQWIDEIICRIGPFTVIFYCFCRMVWLTYRSKHRVGVKNSMANWKTVLVGIYAKSVNTCLVMMTFFLIGTFPEIIISMAFNLNKSVNSDAILFATWMRFSLTVLKPAIYMMQGGKRFSYCWFSACCRNVNMTKLVSLARRPSISVMQSTNADFGFKVSFTKTHDLFAINLQIEDPDASMSSSPGIKKTVNDEIKCTKGNISVKTVSVITK